MKCPYCGTEIQEADKYCAFCGNKVFTEDRVISESKTSTDKKTTSPLKIILIVVLCCALASTALVVGGYALIKSLDIDYSQFFEPSSDNKYGYKDYNEYKYSDTFEHGITSALNRTYTNENFGLSFYLPKEWKVYNKEEIDDLYKEYEISDELIDNNLSVYDFYAEKENDGTSFAIDFYNADYYLGNTSLKDFNEAIKGEAADYAKEENCDIQTAEDSKMNFQGVEYDQLATKYSYDDGSIVYQYDFTRYQNGYFAKISIFSSDINSIGEVISILGSNE